MKKFFIVVMMLAIVACAVACTVDIKYADVKVESIAVDGITKTDYIACDSLNLASASVIISYDNGTYKTIPLTEDMLDKSSFNMDKPGTHKVRVVYEGQSAYFTINISEWKLTSVELYTEPYVLDYIVGEEVDLTGAVIKCGFEGNKIKYFDATKDMLLDYDNQTIGSENINLVFYGKKMSFDVNFSDKTPIKISIVDDATQNFVYKGLGEKFDASGMTVRVFYDNDQSPKYDVKNDLDEDVYISIDDTTARGVDAILMYYPENYKETYTYTFLGVSKVSEGEQVVPGQELSSNEIERNGKKIVLDAVTSKSYGTVSGISANEDGSKTITVSTYTYYDLTIVDVNVGDIIANGDYIGKYGQNTVYANGGGIVERVENGTVTIKTAPTTKFVSNVKEKSFLNMEILALPSPTHYTDTTVDNMIEGDVLNKATGSVRVNYDDGSSANFNMDDELIDLVNYGNESVNANFALIPGRNRILVVYGGVMTNFTEFYATVEQKYPVALELVVDTITGRQFYRGDKISLSTMTYKVLYNNETEGENEQLTADMVDEGYTLDCDEVGNKVIKFRLPQKYSKLLESGGEIRDYIKPTCNYSVLHQPIQSIDFISKPVKVYVGAKSDISYSGAKLDIYYRNNERVTIDVQSKENLQILPVSVDSWEGINTFNYSVESGERLYVFTLNGDNTGISVNEIIRKKSEGYEARVIYFDEYNEKSGSYASYNYYLIDGNTVSSIKVLPLKDKDGKEYYKTNYTQYEDWNFAGLKLSVSYSNGGTEDVDVLPDMVYDSNTYKRGTEIPVKFSYLGAIDDNSLKINVTERKPVAITLVKKGKSEYVGRYGTKIDFSTYTFTLSYNSGPSETIDGSMLKGISNREQSNGWWYKMYNLRGETIENLIQPGKIVYQLHYSYADVNSEDGYSYIGTEYYLNVINALNINSDDEEMGVYSVEVVENRSTVLSIEYLQNIMVDGKTLNPTNGNELNADTDIPAKFPNSNPLPVLAEVATGWEIMLSEYFNGSVLDKVIAVNCIDAENNTYTDYVKITPSMLDYNISDKTIGYRKVTIEYKNQTCETYIYVWKARLTDVDVVSLPLQNYIYTAINSEEDLVLVDGVICLTFTKVTRKGEFAGYMRKYIGMDSEDLTYSGFVKNLYSKEGKQITINIVYKDYTDDSLKASYTITVYDRQDVDFSYTNVIFFYGNAAPASFTMKKKIDEFILPEDITLNYIESANMISLSQYLKLSDTEKESYMPITVYDEDKKMAPVMFIKNTDIVYGQTNNYIDPAPGSYYVKYGTVYMIAEEDYFAFTEEDRAHLIPVPTYDSNGIIVETFYTTANGNLGGSSLADKIKVYNKVIIDKITKAEYENLDFEQKSDYELVNNGYYILMKVVDDRPKETRFYETANYAFRSYTIIQKVIEVKVEAGNEKAKVLKIRTKVNGGKDNGNPYAIYYLHNPKLNIIGTIKSEIESEGVKYISSIYLASPNEDYFEIIVKFMDTYEETAQTQEVVAGIFYKIMKELVADTFYTEMGVKISHINFDYENKSNLYDFNVNDSAGMKDKIKGKWQTGVNIFDKAKVDEGIRNGTVPYNISYTLTFGDTKTRNGVLQLLSGKLVICEDAEDGSSGYKVQTGELGHSSYTLDLSKANVQAQIDAITNLEYLIIKETDN